MTHPFGCFHMVGLPTLALEIPGNLGVVCVGERISHGTYGIPYSLSSEVAIFARSGDHCSLEISYNTGRTLVLTWRFGNPCWETALPSKWQNYAIPPPFQLLKTFLVLLSRWDVASCKGALCNE